MFVGAQVIPSLENMKGNNEEFLVEVVKQWSELERYKKCLQMIFGYVEKVAVTIIRLQTPTFTEICKTQFCNEVRSN